MKIPIKSDTLAYINQTETKLMSIYQPLIKIIINYILAEENLSTEPRTKSLVPNIDIRSANRWLWEIIFNAWKLY